MVEKLTRDHFHGLAKKTFSDPRVFHRMADNPELYNDLVRVAGDNAFYGVPHHTDDALNVMKGINNKWTTNKSAPGHYSLPDDRLHDAVFSSIRGKQPPKSIIGPGAQYEKLRNALHDEPDLGRGQSFKNIADVMDNGVISTLQSMRHPHADDWQRARDKYRSVLMMQDLAQRLHPDIMQDAHEGLSSSRPYLRGEPPMSRPQFNMPMPMSDQDRLLSMLKG